MLYLNICRTIKLPAVQRAVLVRGRGGPHGVGCGIKNEPLGEKQLPLMIQMRTSVKYQVTKIEEKPVRIRN